MNELGNTPADKNHKPSGISKAEERALEAYPIEICGYVTECRVGAKPEPQDWNEERRKCFQEGYEQAEKDLALTPDDIKLITKIHYEIVFKDTTGIKVGDVASEVLKRYLEAKQ